MSIVGYRMHFLFGDAARRLVDSLPEKCPNGLTLKPGEKEQLGGEACLDNPTLIVKAYAWIPNPEAGEIQVDFKDDKIMGPLQEVISSLDLRRSNVKNNVGTSVRFYQSWLFVEFSLDVPQEVLDTMPPSPERELN